MHRFFVIAKGIIDEEFRYWSEHSAYGCSTMPNFYVDEVVDARSEIQRNCLSKEIIA